MYEQNPAYADMQAINAPLPAPGPRIAQSVERLESTLKAIHDCNMRLESSVNRIAGMVPEAPTKSTDARPTADNSIGRIEQLCDDANALLSRLHMLVARVETL